MPKSPTTPNVTLSPVRHIAKTPFLLQAVEQGNAAMFCYLHVTESININLELIQGCIENVVYSFFRAG